MNNPLRCSTVTHPSLASRRSTNNITVSMAYKVGRETIEDIHQQQKREVRLLEISPEVAHPASKHGDFPSPSAIYKVSDLARKGRSPGTFVNRRLSWR